MSEILLAHLGDGAHPVGSTDRPGDSGQTTAEYALVMLAAAAVAGLVLGVGDQEPHDLAPVRHGDRQARFPDGSEPLDDRTHGSERGWARSDRGQSTVELALVLPVLVLFLLALVQTALVARDEVLVQDAARAAVREASVDAGDESGS